MIIFTIFLIDDTIFAKEGILRGCAKFIDSHVIGTHNCSTTKQVSQIYTLNEIYIYNKNIRISFQSSNHKHI